PPSMRTTFVVTRRPPSSTPFPYTTLFRSCVPQILGPVYDTLREVTQVLEDEVNSANDNPVIDHEKEMVYHGGNFHGDYVSLAMEDRKSTRLNSSHVKISYAVFCSKNKTTP